MSKDCEDSGTKTVVTDPPTDAEGGVDRAPDPDEGPQPGSSIDRYLVIDELGRGGMGRVLRVYDPRLQREIALKLLRPNALDAESETRLVREARAMAQLNHPNVVAVYDVEVGKRNGVVLAMELVPGGDLRRWLRAEPRPWREVIARFVAAGRGLSAAHHVGLLHRDFKPSNVLLGNADRVQVTDFGLARLAGSSMSSEGYSGSPEDIVASWAADVTQAGTVVGTPGYMSPEQHEGGELSAATDQFSLCIAIWEGLCGERPYRETGEQLCEAKRRGPPPWPNGTGVPRHVADAVRRGLAPDHRERWPSIDALLTELQRDPGRRRRHVLGVAVVVAVGGGIWGAQRWERSERGSACEQKGAAIVEAWNPDVAAEIEVLVTGTDVSYAQDSWERARPRLDAWVEAWRDASVLVCRRATVEQNLVDTAATAAERCLTEQRRSLAGLLRQLETPDRTTVTRFATAVAALPDPRRCYDERWLANRAPIPQDEALAEQVDAVHLELTEVASLAAAAEHDRALALAQELQARSESIDWLPLRAAVAYQLGMIHARRAEPKDARVWFERAFFEATESGYDELALRASTSLIRTVGYTLALPDEADRWRQQSEALSRRLQVTDSLLGASTRTAVGLLLSTSGQWALALAQYTAALEVWESSVGPTHPRIASVLSNMGAVHSARGDHELSLSAFNRALVIRQEIYGEAHPITADAWSNIGAAAYVAGALEHALEAHLQALAIRKQSLRPGHPDLGATLNNIANLRSDEGNHEEAVRLYESALKIKRDAMGPTHPEVGLALSNLATAHAHADALDKAVPLFDQALAVLEGAQIAPETLAITRNAAAKAMWDAGQQERGVQLARQARDAYAALTHDTATKQRAAIDHWLETHHAPGQEIELPSG